MTRFAKMVFAAAALLPVSSSGQVCVKQLNVPRYPPLAWSAQMSGTVDLTVTIDEQGQVVSVEGSGSWPHLVEQTKANVKEWKFCAPEISRDKNSAHVRLRYDYRLEGAMVYRPPAANVVIDLGKASVIVTLPPPEPQP